MKASPTGHFTQKLHKRSLIWIGLAILMILLSDVLKPSFIDRWYYQGLFKWIRVTYDFLLSWSPVPMLYVAILIVIIRTVLWIRNRKKGPLYMVLKALGGIAFLIFLFYFAWGFNYNQITLQTKLGLDLKNADERDIAIEFRRATQQLKDAVAQLPTTSITDEAIANQICSDDQIRPDVQIALKELQLSDAGHVNVRQIWPPGILLRWSTAGIYIPQTFEGQIDKGLLSVQKPFTLAHEMAHGYGITDEGACNFIAWLACNQSSDPWTRFGGAFTYWRYAAYEMPRDSVEQVLKSMDDVVLRSLKLVKQNDLKYPDILPQIRDAIYSNYLEHHGVEGGLRSYNYVVLMVIEYLKKKNGASQ